MVTRAVTGHQPASDILPPNVSQVVQTHRTFDSARRHAVGFSDAYCPTSFG
jgi:hypothetical protein